MTAATDLTESAGATALARDANAPVLRWMIFTGLTAFAAVVMHRYGLFGLMLASDKTYISAVILALYALASLHCLWRSRALAREESAAALDQAALERDAAAVLDDGARRLPDGVVTDHIRNLIVKAREQRGGALDQTLLLRALAERLRGSNGFGAFASDTLMKLGLLGTIVGFIVMLAPIAGLDPSDKSGMRGAMGVMGEGMAIAMYTTLAGLVASILLRIQYYMLDAATARLFARIVTLTETRVTPALERRHAR